MPSGRKSRATRRVADVPTSRKRQASPKALAAGAILVVVAAVAIVLGVVLSGGKSTAPPVAAVGSLQSGLPGAAAGGVALQGHPAARHDARAGVGSGDAPRVRRSPVPVLQGGRDRGRAGHPHALRALGEGEDRRPAARLQRRLVQGPQRDDRRRPPEPGLQLRPDAVRQPGHREHRLAERRDGREGGREHPRPACLRSSRRAEGRRRLEARHADRLHLARRRTSTRPRRSWCRAASAARSRSSLPRRQRCGRRSTRRCPSIPASPTREGHRPTPWRSCAAASTSSRSSRSSDARR